MDALWNSRTELLLGKDNTEKLHQSHVLVVGLGGVGAYAAEALVRAGIGQISILDSDVVTQTNRNRQLIALESTQDQAKTKVLKQRLLDINPELNVHTYSRYISYDDPLDFLDQPIDYVVDAIDTLTPKVYLIQELTARNIPFVSSMGSGGKLDPTMIRVDYLSKTFNCGLARYMRKRLRKYGVSEKFTVVFSPETKRQSSTEIVDEQNKKSNSGTISYMPAMFGLYAASVVIRQLTGM